MTTYSVRLFDNGGTTLDRYTAVYEDDETGDQWYRGMSEHPFHPQGYGIADSGDVSGTMERDEEIDVASAPPDVQQCILMDTTDCTRTVAQRVLELRAEIRDAYKLGRDPQKQLCEIDSLIGE